MTDGPLIVQSDKTMLLEVDHADSAACRKAIAPFAELERAPEHIHTYRLTPPWFMECTSRRARCRECDRHTHSILPLPRIEFTTY